MSMFQAVALAYDIIAAPFRRTSVASVVADMEKQVERLFAVAADNIHHAEKCRDKADALIDKANAEYRAGNACEDEAERALRVAERFTNLIR